jgi:hypothetical protein
MTATTLDRAYQFPDIIDATTLPRILSKAPRDPYATDYVLPAPVVIEAPDVTQKLHDLVQWTEWSNRIIAQVIGVSHPTVGQALAGHAGALSRRADAVERLDLAHDIAERVFILAKRDAKRAAEALDTANSEGITATDYLIEGGIADAYLTAIRALRPPRSGSMMASRYAMDPRRASASVYDEE